MMPKKKQIDLEELSIFYHNVAAKELVVNNQKNLITTPTQPYIEWEQLDEEKKEGRRIMMRELLKQYSITEK